MRTISVDQAKVLAAGHRAVHFRVSVKDSGGTFRDLTTYPGISLVKRATWHDDVDSNGPAFEVELLRELESVSLGPFMQDSPLNRGFNPAASYAALLALARELKIEWALVPADAAPAAGDWQLGFHGYIDRINAGPPVIRVEGRDLSAKLQDTQIERVRHYAFAQGAGATKGLYIFETSRAYALNELVRPTDARLNGKYFKVTTAGTSGSSEPTWPTTGTVGSGSVVFTKEGDTSPTTGTAVETVIQQILDDNLGAGVVTLTTPVSPGWTMKPWVQDKLTSIWSVIRDLVDLFGWDLRYVYDSGTSSMKLKLLQPDRAASSPVRTFGATEYSEIEQLEQDIAGIRNRVVVYYADSADKDAAGTPKRKTVQVDDSASQTKYGVRAMGLSEDKTPQIDTGSEATTLANAVLSDLKEPTAAQAARMPFFPFAELGDLYRYSPNARHYSTNFDAAAVGYQHDLSADGRRTTITCRGKPSGGWQRWLENEVRQGVSAYHETTFHGWQTGLGLSGTPIIGGFVVMVEADEAKESTTDIVEVHASKSAGFTPSAATLKRVGRAKRFEIEELDPGDTYYCQVVPVGENRGRIVRGLPSNEISVVAGRAKPIHIDPETVVIPLPPNGSFEGRFRGAASPPDLWAMVTGDWTTDADWEASTVYDGTYSVLLKSTAVAAKLRTEYFPVRPGWGYALAAHHRNNTAIDTAKYLDLSIEWYTAAKASISTSTLSVNLNALGTTSWILARTQVTAPATAAFARVSVAKQTADAYGVYVDGLSLVGAEPWIAPSLSNNWANYGAPFGDAGYFIDPEGIVHLKGLVKCATGTPVATVLFTLPVGYRPAYEATYLQGSSWAATGEAATRLNVKTNGDVQATAVVGSATPGLCTFLSLDFAFRAGV